MKLFQLATEFQPSGDQPNAIEKLTQSILSGEKHQVLKGVTGSGKTFTMAHIINNIAVPTLVIAPNKTLAAQLFTELKEFFPSASIEFFISYYDYYQPEAYVPTSDTYIAKDSSINDDIDKMRHAATQALFERKDVVIVASVSCIYGMGSPASYARHVINLEVGQELPRNDFLRQLIDIQYSRNDISLTRGSFRVRGDVIDILPSHQQDTALRVEFFGDDIEKITEIDSLTGQLKRSIQSLSIYPNSHYVTDRKGLKTITREILTDLGKRLKELKQQNRLVEYQRLEERTMQDVELLEELGFCPGIENYSRYLTGQPPGQPPPTLLNYFPKNFLTIIDESHVTVPQLNGMYRGDRARKQNLVDYGFRLPAALDNRPLNFTEFLNLTESIIHVSATPGKFELEAGKQHIVEQIIRPTGLVDPPIEVKSATNQIDDLYGEIQKTVSQGFRILITTLTKRMAEDLNTYYEDLGVKVRYLHSDIDSLERVDILRDLRQGVFDVLIGINLLREGLDLPEVGLVGILDADKQGFLRSQSSLIQTVGRAARNSQGRVIFYADKVSESMAYCIEETHRRRAIQIAYNKKHGIKPTSISKKITTSIRELYGLNSPRAKDPENPKKLMKQYQIESTKQLEKLIAKKTKEMKTHAEKLEFEKAAELRDMIASLKETLLAYGNDVAMEDKNDQSKE